MFICKNCGTPTGIYIDIKTGKRITKNIDKLKIQDLDKTYNYYFNFCRTCGRMISSYPYEDIEWN